jgi:arginase
VAVLALSSTGSGASGRVRAPRLYHHRMPAPIVIVGSPTALGGHIAGMDRTPAELRRRGVTERLAARPGLRGRSILDAGDAPIEPGWAPDPDTRAKNRTLLIENLPRVADHVAAALDAAGPDARLHLIGGDCTSHAAALAGLRRRVPGRRLALAWFDAHGDSNTPGTTPSGNVWGMPFAMACGRGDPDLVAAVDGPTVREDDAALLGGHVLDEAESRMLASSRVAHFGTGMLGGPAGLAALAAWATTVATRVDACYIAFDMDVLDAADGWALTMPEPDGISLATALAAVRILADAMPIAGIGTTAMMVWPETSEADVERTIDAVAALGEAALGTTAHDEMATGPAAATRTYEAVR